MLKIRIIPCLDVKNGRVVKGVNFVNLVDAGDPVEAAQAYDEAGADELCNPNFIKEASEAFGSQCIVVAIDAKRNNDGWQIFTHGGREPTGLDPIDFAKKAESLGAGEILLTSMDRDGTKKGYDTALLNKITKTLEIPVIASGGVGNIDHLIDGIKEGGASAVLAASIFHFGEITIKEVKDKLSEEGLSVRK